jgi:hypothetical protein
MSWSSGVGNGCDRGVGGGRGLGRGGLGGGLWEDPLPRRPGLHFHCEITLRV